VPTTATLGELLTDLRAELGQTLSTTQATQVIPAHRVKLQRVQRTLWEAYAWPHLRTRWDVDLSAGQRYYDLPATPPGLTLERLESVHVYWSGDWHPVDRGITPDEYNAYDSDNDERSDPVLKWDTRPDGQIEVWPLPASDDMVLRFHGIRALGDFVADDDECTLDRDLLVLTAAAELATTENDIRRFASRAEAHFAKITGNATHSGDRVFRLGGDTRRKGRWPTPPRVSG
jgi:hypothetical protein